MKNKYLVRRINSYLVEVEEHYLIATHLKEDELTDEVFGELIAGDPFSSTEVHRKWRDVEETEITPLEKLDEESEEFTLFDE